jgi:hypothetical protein
VATGRDLCVAQDAVVHAFARVLGPTGRHDANRFVPVSTRLLAVTREASIDGAAGDGATDLAYLGDTAPEGTALAFDGLPEKWRSALWLLHGEHLDLAATGAVLGLSRPEAEQLSERALAGLREQLAEVRLPIAAAAECERTVSRLSGYVADALDDGDAARVRRHLDLCEECRVRLDEVDDLTARLRDLVPALPLAIEAVAADAWLARIRERSGPIGLRLPGGQLAPAWAERGLATATAAMVTFGITAAVMLGARGGDGRPTEPIDAASGLGEQAIGGATSIDVDTVLDPFSTSAFTPSSSIPDASAGSPGTSSPSVPPAAGPSPVAPTAGDVSRGTPVPATKPRAQAPSEPSAPPEASPPSSPPSGPPASPITVVDDIVEALDPVVEGVCGAVPVCPPLGADTELPTLPQIPGL